MTWVSKLFDLAYREADWGVCPCVFLFPEAMNETQDSRISVSSPA